VNTPSNDINPRPAVLIVDDEGPRRDALVRLCDEAGWFVQVVNQSPPQAPLHERDLQSIEREHIQRVLLAHGGNVSETARVLGVDRRTLQRKLRELRGPAPSKTIISLPLRSSESR
jgi:transcriptional regulator with GAF, ATPase, and Fis domain